MGKLLSLAMGSCALAAASLGAARADDDISKHLINNPNVSGINLMGPQTNFMIKDPKVQGGMGVEVKIAAASANPWDSAAETQITGAIHKGDKIIGAVWLRCKNTDGTPCQVNLRIQGNQAPWPGLIQDSDQVGGDWQMYSVQTVATQDFPKATSAMDVHLATTKQVIDIGPMFVLNMGPGGQ